MMNRLRLYFGLPIALDCTPSHWASREHAEVLSAGDSRSRLAAELCLALPYAVRVEVLPCRLTVVMRLPRRASASLLDIGYEVMRVVEDVVYDEISKRESARKQAAF